MNEEISVGIVGMGKMGIMHAGILNNLNGVSVKAVADTQKLITHFIENQLTGINAYDNYEEMLSKEDLDVVYITTPTSLHPRVAVDCVNNGIPFFVEKPLGINTESCAPLLKLLQKTYVTNMIGYSKRFVSTFKMAKQIIDNKELGEMIYFNSTMYVSQLFSRGRGWRYDKEISGGGVLNTLGTHLIDLLLWFFGDYSYVQGGTKRYYSSDVEDFAHAYIAFNSGIEGTIDTSWSVRNYRLPEIKIEVHCSRGMFVVTDDYIKIFTDADNAWKEYYKQDFVSGVDFDLGGPEYTMEDKHMVECVKKNVKTDLDVFEGFAVQKVIEEIYKTASNKAEMGVNTHDY